jgi:hypothetical protein
MVNKIEDLISIKYNCFSEIFKLHLEFPKLAMVMETNGAKILKNVKIHCMFMLSPMGHVMSKYMTLLMKMVIDGPNNDKANLLWLILTYFVVSKFVSYYRTPLVAINSQLN